MDVIELSGVSKKYKVYAHPGDRLKELLAFGARQYHREHWALRDVSFSIRKGETFCIIGENGSGKSTLLQVITGILQPTSGAVRAGGRITALLELGSGFNPEFTGRDNVYLNGAILGLSKADVAGRLDAVLDFAEIGDYIDQPVKTYSSGMVVRLAFALAVHLDPDILVVDEALAVGDIYFRQRCMRKIHELRSNGVTIVYVTHDIGDVKAIGHRTVWLDQGRVREIGDSGEVAGKYVAALLKKDASQLRGHHAASVEAASAVGRPAQVVTNLPAVVNRHGDGRAEILGIEIADEGGNRLDCVRTPARIAVRMSVRAVERIELPIAGVLVRTAQGLDFAGTNTSRESVPIPPMAPGDIHTVDFRIRLPELAPGRFTFTPGIADGTLLEFQLCDMIEDAVSLEVLPGDAPVYGYVHIPCVSVSAKP